MIITSTKIIHINKRKIIINDNQKRKRMERLHGWPLFLLLLLLRLLTPLLACLSGSSRQEEKESNGDDGNYDT